MITFALEMRGGYSSCVMISTVGGVRRWVESRTDRGWEHPHEFL